MKVLILAGGLGTRLAEETSIRPKPMVEIGGFPILWHIMQIYSHYGFNDFIILLGYKGYIIKEYFANFFLHNSDISINLKDNSIEILNSQSQNWRVTLLDTGKDTMTGGRILQAKPYIGNERFMLTYGDGLSDVNLHALLAFHKAHKKLATLTAIQPEGRYGAIAFGENDRVEHFLEKPKGDSSPTGWVNGGFFVCECEVLSYIKDNQSIFEQAPLITLAKDKQLQAYKHYGFWQCMDTLRDKQLLEELWRNNPKWKVWQ
ncbi:glucose-1-phosphate cytidylyltransferase [Helicobacter marmotae]|uniref:Glucose-1-phosphate cytidylyltransferase n=1 Tax=Helicobacter marmotae TaxID=152490 RepID=A0A3D8I306_9HELI|nr:glucose-1-phosphate cytidylyltransferase [Helicobacter marmotae]RDU59114.1 glucose-1-phosphate cytidylyltransferase [Helicobacter marmotae]